MPHTSLTLKPVPPSELLESISMKRSGNDPKTNTKPESVRIQHGTSMLRTLNVVRIPSLINVTLDPAKFRQPADPLKDASQDKTPLADTRGQSATTRSQTPSTAFPRTALNFKLHYKVAAQELRAFMKRSDPDLNLEHVLRAGNESEKEDWINKFLQTNNGSRFSRLIVQKAVQLMSYQPTKKFQRHRATDTDKELIAMVTPEACQLEPGVAAGYRSNLRKVSEVLRQRDGFPGTLRDLVGLGWEAYSKTLTLLAADAPNVKQAVNKLRNMLPAHRESEDRELRDASLELLNLRLAPPGDETLSPISASYGSEALGPQQAVPERPA